ncbi:uncharacterized protein LOC126981236 [Eriocheir sinensis]|uniref:uncharacterized protein LOC126981236 n=1 Tax=Eriocheir sinensis TaxID=95602 RepID=UPI0021C681CC|nr:uncharacterized protein LOC126981236 [Eriocheir sinensis]
MMMVMLWVLCGALLSVASAAGGARSCYHCRVRESCLTEGEAKVRRCAPAVDHCVRKLTLSRVTGVAVTEMYCGGRDFLNAARDRGLVEERCYTEEEELVLVEGRDRRTTTTVCYCAADLCNAHPPPPAPPAALVFLLPLLLVFLHSVSCVSVLPFSSSSSVVESLRT